ncbi:hypothetical protein ACFV9C_42535 [Kribbella sp. NPDC059898]|uniref:hypothetical protein n=1 Tax=Kribbella sp. NPDC059898 TaxID=3346995 RepID=UPI003652BF65
MIATVPLDIADGSGFTGWANKQIGELGTLAKTAGVVFPILLFVVVSAMKRTIAAVLSVAAMCILMEAMVVGGLVWGGKKVTEDLNNGAPAIAQVQVASRAGI